MTPSPRTSRSPTPTGDRGRSPGHKNGRPRASPDSLRVELDELRKKWDRSKDRNYAFLETDIPDFIISKYVDDYSYNYFVYKRRESQITDLHKEFAGALNEAKEKEEHWKVYVEEEYSEVKQDLQELIYLQSEQIKILGIVLDKMGKGGPEDLAMLGWEWVLSRSAEDIGINRYELFGKGLLNRLRSQVPDSEYAHDGSGTTSTHESIRSERKSKTRRRWNKVKSKLSTLGRKEKKRKA